MGIVKEIPVGVNIGDEVVRFGQIHRAFAVTEHGQKLARSTRYDRYKPDGITNEKWERVLGVDVNNLKHLQLTYGLTRRFIEYTANPSRLWQKAVSAQAQFTPEEQEDLLLAATVHDWAEAVVGDKMFDLKTRAEEDEELAVLQTMVQNLYRREEAQVIILRIDNVINTVIKDRNTKLGRAFNAIERVGYLRTALRAWQKSREADEELRTGLQWLTNNRHLAK